MAERLPASLLKRPSAMFFNSSSQKADVRWRSGGPLYSHFPKADARYVYVQNGCPRQLLGLTAGRQPHHHPHTKPRPCDLFFSVPLRGLWVWGGGGGT